MRIRVAGKGDIAAVDALLARAYPRLLKAAYPPSVMVTALPLISRAQPALVTCGTYFVAEAEEGALLAAGGWTRDRRVAGRGHIRHVVTDDRQVRRGIGRRLLAHVLDDARAAGMHEMECWATRNAVPFYAALGFAEEGPIDVELQQGITFPSVRMRLALPAAR